MPPTLLLTVLLLLSALAYWQGRRRALAVSARPAAAKMHSRPGYYGMLTALWCGLPALLIFALWQMSADSYITSHAIKGLVAGEGPLSPDQLNLLVNDLRNLISGTVVSREVNPALQAAADRYLAMEGLSRTAMAVLVLAVALGAGCFAWSRIRPALRARNQV
jgi:phosphate transport system permease protein